MIEVWTGTPNEMVKAASKPSQPGAVKWARDWLAGFKKQALIFDNAAVEGIQFVMDDMGKAVHLSKQDTLGWSFTFLDATLRVELRKT